MMIYAHIQFGLRHPDGHFGSFWRLEGCYHGPQKQCSWARGARHCESLLLLLTERAILSVDEARAVLEDAAAANLNAIPLEADGEQHKAAAERIELILAGRNSVWIE